MSPPTPHPTITHVLHTILPTLATCRRLLQAVVQSKFKCMYVDASAQIVHHVKPALQMMFRPHLRLLLLAKKALRAGKLARAAGNSPCKHHDKQVRARHQSNTSANFSSISAQLHSNITRKEFLQRAATCCTVQ